MSKFFIFSPDDFARVCEAFGLLHWNMRTTAPKNETSPNSSPQHGSKSGVKATEGSSSNKFLGLSAVPVESDEPTANQKAEEENIKQFKFIEETWRQSLSTLLG